MAYVEKGDFDPESMRAIITVTDASGAVIGFWVVWK